MIQILQKIQTLDSPRVINPAETFTALVQWFQNEILIQKNAPGFLIGLSGTDSLVAFCAASKALELVDKADRMLGVHFAPSEDFLYDHPEAEVHLWFQEQVVPWLKNFSPNSKIEIDTSIDWRYDGLRWGKLMDLSVVTENKTRTMRLPEEQYWVVGTRNRTENTLLNYSNASTCVSLQPLIHLWKSEILEISKHLGIPEIAIAKSCETDCICGRDRLASNHIKEVDLMLMASNFELSKNYIINNVEPSVSIQLKYFINSQIKSGLFKKQIPYMPSNSVIHTVDDLVQMFESGDLDLKQFNHRKHIYVAWYYLKSLSFDDSLTKYSKHLNEILIAAGKPGKFNLLTTESYFHRISDAIQANPTDNFEEFLENSSELLKNK